MLILCKKPMTGWKFCCHKSSHYFIFSTEEVRPFPQLTLAYSAFARACTRPVAAATQLCIGVSCSRTMYFAPLWQCYVPWYNAQRQVLHLHLGVLRVFYYYQTTSRARTATIPERMGRSSRGVCVRRCACWRTVCPTFVVSSHELDVYTSKC